MSRFAHRRPFGFLLIALASGAGIVGASLIFQGGVAASAASSSTSSPPLTVTASSIARTPGTVRPGTTVRSGALSTRVFPDAHHGFALASVSNVTYPAATANGGGKWRIDGPALHLPAAQAPLVVTQAGAANSRTYFAWGGPDGGGPTVDVTSDGGRHWRRAFLGEVVMAVVPGNGGRLIAFAQSSASSTTSTAVTWVYVSRDGGRHWHYDNLLGAT